jgi:3-polyprenyl-4-hydroxybenzoate decarboxylase
MGMVLWAVASRVQPHRDCLITTPNNLGCPLDPSIPDEHKGFPKARSSRLLIDATKYHKPGTTFSAMVLDPPEAKKRVADRWKEYGFTFNY